MKLRSSANVSQIVVCSSELKLSILLGVPMTAFNSFKLESKESTSSLTALLNCLFFYPISVVHLLTIESNQG
jgi:hypothetical protein